VNASCWNFEGCAALTGPIVGRARQGTATLLRSNL
jgi:hypothetical protein